MAIPPQVIQYGVPIVGSILGGIFGGGKKQDIPSFNDTYKRFREENAGQIGLSKEQVAQILSVGTGGISRERDIGVAGRKASLKNAGLQDSVAMATTSLQGAAQAQQQFGKLAIGLGSLEEQARSADEARLFSQAATAHQFSLQEIQLAEQLEVSQQNRFQSYIDQFIDPFESFALLQELEKIEDLYKSQGSFNQSQQFAQSFMRFGQTSGGGVTEESLGVNTDLFPG